MASVKVGRLAVWLMAGVLMQTSALTQAKEKEFTSVQIRAPMSTALLSAATMGLWPRQFGDDLEEVVAPVPGWSRAQAASLLPHAREAFERWRQLWWLLGSVIGVVVVQKKFSKKSANRNKCFSSEANSGTLTV